MRGQAVADDLAELGLVGFAAVQRIFAITTGNGFGQPSAEKIVDGVQRLIVGLRPRVRTPTARVWDIRPPS